MRESYAAIKYRTCRGLSKNSTMEQGLRTEPLVSPNLAIGKAGNAHLVAAIADGPIAVDLRTLGKNLYIGYEG